MKETNQVTIERVFEAPLEKVWEAWTKPEEIKKWWGPEGFSAPEIEIDFRVGGKYHYMMRGPIEEGGEEMDMWSGGEFKEIVPHEKIVATDHFSNEAGDTVDPATFGMSEDFPKESDMTILFQRQGDSTKLSIIYEGVSAKAYEAYKQSGMHEGWQSSLNKLEKALTEN